jgi:Fur family ferric uptake transcriptional regulator
MAKGSAVERTLEVFRDYITRHGLKFTRQREVILKAFLESEGHVSAEELYRTVSAEEPSLGLATVYRTLNLLVECGLAQRRQFGEGQRRYEHVLDHEHHDHLICTRCGSISEFYSPEIEDLQEEVSREHKFRVFSHRLELYGLCPTCQD